MRQAVDWETLEARSETFVDPKLKNLQSDVLYRARLVGGGELYLYVLLEHQNKRDYLMPFRLLQYMVRIWERWLQESGGKRPLPFILPMVLYNGERRWPVPLQFQELFPSELREPLSAHIPAFVYQLQDLSQTSDEELTGEALRQMVLLLLKWGKSEDFWERFPEWLHTMRDIYDQPQNGLRDRGPAPLHCQGRTGSSSPGDLQATLHPPLPNHGGVLHVLGRSTQAEGAPRGLGAWARRRPGARLGARHGARKARSSGAFSSALSDDAHPEVSAAPGLRPRAR